MMFSSGVLPSRNIFHKYKSGSMVHGLFNPELCVEFSVYLCGFPLISKKHNIRIGYSQLPLDVHVCANRSIVSSDGLDSHPGYIPTSHLLVQASDPPPQQR